MSSQQVKLRFQPGTPTVSLRSLTGHAERGVRDVSTACAVDLLEQLVEWPTGTMPQTRELTAPDRDRLLAAIYQGSFGGKIASTARCTACSSPFDLSFLLEDLLTAQERSAAAGSARALPDGTFVTASGLRFRLPTAREEIELAMLPAEQGPHAIAARCVLHPDINGNPTQDLLDELESVLEEVAPPLDLDISTSCPECNAPQTAHFDLQFYLLRAIEQQRNQMVCDVHRIASAYGWHLDEILGLERTERRALVQLIEGELPTRRRTP